jgi:hydrogenase large subunit
VRLFGVLREFRQFVEQTVFADTLEKVAALDTPAALDVWASQRDADFPRFLAVAQSLGLGEVGRASDRFLSFGAYEEDSASLFPAGVWQAEFDEVQALDAGRIVEDVSHAWLAGDVPLPPLQGETRPLADGKAGAYTWCKAPRYAGQVVETGALARQVLSQHPLALGLVRAHGGSVLARVTARMLEVARLLPQMEGWLRAIEPGESFCAQWESPQQAEGIGLVEAARGSLGHWLRIEHGKIASYQIIAPTTWNFSPRDTEGQPGALEQALVGLSVADGDKNPVLVQHVVRSFDPCMVCTVH